MRQGQPLIYQQVDGVKRAVSAVSRQMGSRAGFSVGEYDHSRPLVIDPAIILYSTYLAVRKKTAFTTLLRTPMAMPTR